MASQAQLITPDQLADALWFGASDPSSPPPLLVDLSEPLAPDDHLLESTLRAARTCARVTIGIAAEGVPEANLPLAEALTLCLAPHESADQRSFVGVPDPLAAAYQLVEIVAGHPLASAALTMLLQQTAVLPVWEGLVAESATYSMLLAGPEFAAWLAAAPSRRPARKDDEPVLVARQDDVLTLTLNRPDRRNAYGHAIRDAMVAALLIARIDETVTVEWEGRGAAFCSGGDLAEFGTTPDAATAHLIRVRQSTGLLLHEMAARVTVHLHGACIGAGIELAAFAGRVIARPDTRIGLPELSMGLVPGAGGTVSIVRRIGRWRTAWLALTGQRIGAEQALRWGLVDELAS